MAVSSPFDAIQIHCADYDTLRNPDEGFLSEGVLIMKVDLKHIVVTTECTRRTLGEDMRIVNVGLFNRHSITLRLKGGKVFGLLPDSKIRTIIYTANLLVHQFLESVRPLACFHQHTCSVQVAGPLNWRFWLFERSLNGTLFLKRCLNEAGPTEVFGNVCNKWDGRHGWITLFLEDKGANEKLEPVSDGTIIVFCKLFEPDVNVVRYLGHLLLDRTMPCSDLLTCVVRMANLSNDKDFGVYIEEMQFCIREITGIQSSLEEVPILNLRIGDVSSFRVAFTPFQALS